EEGVVELLAPQRRRPVRRNQKAGRAIFLLGRIVHQRNVQQRHAFDVENRLAKHRVVIDIENHGFCVELPAGSRLHAAGEAAVFDLVLLGTDLLYRLTEEIDVCVLTDNGRWREAAWTNGSPLGLRGGDPPRMIERAEMRLDVEVRPVGGDPVVALGKYYVT